MIYSHGAVTIIIRFRHYSEIGASIPFDADAITMRKCSNIKRDRSFGIEVAKGNTRVFNPFSQTRDFQSTNPNTKSMKKQVILAIGGPATGKTRWAYAHMGRFWEMPLYPRGAFLFEGFDDHKKVLIDDFCGDASQVHMEVMFRLLNTNGTKVPQQYKKNILFNPDFIYITTNIHPRAWYSWNESKVTYKQFISRFTSVWVFDDKTTCKPVKMTTETYFNK